MKLGYSEMRGLGLLLAVAFALDLPAQEKRTVTPEDLVRLRGVSDVQISPDGRRVAFVVTEPADPQQPGKARDSNIWIVPANGSEPARPFAASIHSDFSPRWSPDGRWLAFLSNRGGPLGGEKAARNQIYLLRTDGGEAEQLTALRGGIGAFEWSADGAMIACTVTDPPTDEEVKKQSLLDDAKQLDHNYKYSRLWVLSLSDRKARLVTTQGFHVTNFAWSPDGTEFALTVAPTPRRNDVFWHSSLVVLRRQTGEVVRTLSKNISRFGPPAKWSPDGQTLVFTEQTPNRIAGWLALAPSAGGPVRYLLKDYRGTLWDFRWAPDSKHLLAESVEGTKAKLLHIDTETGNLKRLAEVFISGPDFSVSADGNNLAYVSQAPDSPGEVWALPIGKSPVRLTHLHPGVRDLRLGEVSEVTWKNKKDGHIVYGVLITPPGFQAERPYPTIVHVHGGPHLVWWSGWHGSWHEWGQMLASHGYVVFLPNPRGSTGQDWQFAEGLRDDLGGSALAFQDIMDGVDHLLEQKIADPDRLGIGGFSYGGFFTAWAVTHTDRFKSAIAAGAITNFFSWTGTTNTTPTYQRHLLLDVPFRRRSAYDNNSPTTFLENCKTPLLILHGENDDIVPVGQGWEIYNGLRMLGREAQMVVYPREAHGIGEPAHQVDYLHRVLSWYDKHLKR